MREDEVRRLIRLLEEHEGVEEIEFSTGPLGFRRLRVSRRGTGQSAPAAAAPAAAREAAAAPAPEPAETAGLHSVKAPMVGTFYAASSPEAAPYVSEGTRVAPGTVLCIIEAMKLMNEIESDVSGTVREIVAENGQPVEFGQVLFRIEEG
jgi:acetyl-CoA carboxylase biotin carboxyl carrier protein